jgi:hypothetical protein
VEEASIAQPDPPDIVCNIRGLGSVAFELPTLSATAVHRRLGHWPEMPTPIKTTIKPLKTHRATRKNDI